MYHVKWILEKRIILFQADGDQTIETIEDGVGRLGTLIQQGEAPVHVLSDSRNIGKFPASMSAMKHLMKSYEETGYTVVIGGNALTKFVSMMLTKASGGRDPIYSKDITEAIATLKRLDASLPPTIPYEDVPPDSTPTD